MFNIQYRCTRYKSMGMFNVQYRSRQTFIVQTYVMSNIYIDGHIKWTFTVQTYGNVQYPISMYMVDIHCTNLRECPISNIDGHKWTFTVQTYGNVQYPISMYKVYIHCTNLRECPTFKKPHRYSLYKYNVNVQYPISN